MQKFVAIWWPATELQQGELSIEFELRRKIVNETGPQEYGKINRTNLLAQVLVSP